MADAGDPGGWDTRSKSEDVGPCRYMHATQNKSLDTRKMGLVRNVVCRDRYTSGNADNIWTAGGERISRTDATNEVYLWGPRAGGEEHVHLRPTGRRVSEYRAGIKMLLCALFSEAREISYFFSEFILLIDLTSWHSTSPISADLQYYQSYHDARTNASHFGFIIPS